MVVRPIRWSALIPALLLAVFAITSLKPVFADTSAAFATEKKEASETQPVHLDTSNFTSKTTEGVVLIDFWAPWCGPCRKQIPILDDVAKEIGGKALIGKVNIDASQAIAKKFKVSSIPTLIVLVDGKPVKRFVGVQNKSVLTDAIDDAVSKSAAIRLVKDESKKEEKAR